MSTTSGHPLPSPATPVPHPTTRECPFDPPQALGRFRDEQPLRRMACIDGHDGWLITSDELVRRLLTDARLTNRMETLHPVISHPSIEARFGEPTSPGDFFHLDPPDHTRLRRQVTACFNTHRLRALTPRIEQIIEDELEALERSGSPADLVAKFALTVPSLVISELLGVPYADRDEWHHYNEVIMSMEATAEEGLAAFQAGNDYMHALIQVKRAEPDEALLSTLVRNSDLDDDELAGIAWMMHSAGYETTASMLSAGTFALLMNPDQMAALREDPSLVDNAVEELLRYLTIVQFGAWRAAAEDIDVDGTVIKAGETVAFSLSTANRDPQRFDEPDSLDVFREVGPHLAFGRGIHACIGQQLARIELRLGFTALLRRFPGLRLAISPDEVTFNEQFGFYGVDRLPVAW